MIVEKSYFILEIKDGWPSILGPYATADQQKRAGREMMAQGRQVFWLDTSPGPAYVGCITKKDDNQG